MLHKLNAGIDWGEMSALDEAGDHRDLGDGSGTTISGTAMVGSSSASWVIVAGKEDMTEECY